MLQKRKEIKQLERKMKIIEVDEELYQYIASQTKSIGESASDILRRLLNFSSLSSAPQSQSTAPHREASSRSNQKTSAERRMRQR